MRHSLPLPVLLLALSFLTTAAVADEPSPTKLVSAEPLSVADLTKLVRPAVVVITHEDRDGKQAGVGSGFIVDGNGLIATNLHVIGEARPIGITLADGRKLEVISVEATDRLHDLALLRVAERDLPALELGDSDTLAQGEQIVVMGNPHGLKHSVVTGVVSERREIEGRRMIQLAIPIEPGNSGGPVLDMRGRVHGVVTMKSLVNDNLGFAIEINDLKPMIAKPNPVLIDHWLTMGRLDPRHWEPLFGATWRRRGGVLAVAGSGDGFGGRSLCLSNDKPPKLPFEIAVNVKLDSEAGAAGLVFHSNGADQHYGFYPSAGQLRLTRFEGPNVFTWKVLADVPSEAYRPGRFNHLKVRVEADRIRCYVNDTLVIDSTEVTFSSGQVGMCKFRDTQAEFKGFRVAKEIPPTLPSAELDQQLTATIEQLPALSTLQQESLEPLVAHPQAAAYLLAREAEALEQRANQLRQVAADVHTGVVVKELLAELSQPEEKIDLARAALLIAKLDDPTLDADAYLAELAALATEVTSELKQSATADDRIAALNQLLFKQLGFHGGRTNYYHRANSYLNRVMDDREGLPITLSLLYMELAHRVGVKVEGVGLPSHFIVRYETANGEQQLLDPFEQGEKLSRDQAANLVREMAGIPLVEEHLTAVDKRAMSIRMLTNLLGSAQRGTGSGPDKVAMLGYLEALLALTPDSAQYLGMRAVVRYELGRWEAALTDLDTILEQNPPGVDLDRIRELRDYFARNQPPALK